MRVGRFILALLMITAGVIAFLINMGYGSWASYQLLGQWWPLLLIILGLSMFWQGRIPPALAYSLVIVIVAAIVGYMVFNEQVLPINPGSRQSWSNQEIVVAKNEHPGIKSGELTISFGGGRLAISPAAGPWFEGRVTGGLQQKSVEADNSALHIMLKGTENQNFWLPGQDNHDNNSSREWDLKLAPDLDWRLDANIGAVAADMNLNQVKLSELKCDLGAGALNLILGNNGPYTHAAISGGASSIKVKVPAGTGVKVIQGSALTSDNLDEMGWVRTGNTYTSPGYDQAASRVELEIHLGAGSFSLEQY